VADVADPDRDFLVVDPMENDVPEEGDVIAAYPAMARG
jgi:hypothetical protein